jgi:predicted transcriptional regulator
MSIRRIQLGLSDEITDALERLAREDRRTRSAEVICLIKEEIKRRTREESKS